MGKQDTVNELLAGFIWATLALAGNVLGLYWSLLSRNAGSSMVLVGLVDIGLALLLLKAGKKTEAIAVGCAAVLGIGLLMVLLTVLPLHR